MKKLRHACFSLTFAEIRRMSVIVEYLRAAISVQIWLSISGSSHPEIFVKKVFLKISRNSLENTCAIVSFLIKLHAAKRHSSRHVTLLKKRLWDWCFPVNFAKFLRTPFFIEHLRWLLLWVEALHFVKDLYILKKVQEWTTYWKTAFKKIQSNIVCLKRLFHFKFFYYRCLSQALFWSIFELFISFEVSNNVLNGLICWITWYQSDFVIMLGKRGVEIFAFVPLE